MQTIVDFGSLPAGFPTHRHVPAFWEALGRAVATFGYLEETLAKAIFAFTGMRQYPEHEAAARLDAWLPQLKRALSAPLGQLIDLYAGAVKDFEAVPLGFDNLIVEMRTAASIRNVLCHGSWRSPDADGYSLIQFMRRDDMLFDTPVDLAFLYQVQSATSSLAVAVVNTVTTMGWQFPGSNGPGRPIM